MVLPSRPHLRAGCPAQCSIGVWLSFQSAGLAAAVAGAAITERHAASRAALAALGPWMTPLTTPTSYCLASCRKRPASLAGSVRLSGGAAAGGIVGGLRAVNWCLADC